MKTRYSILVLLSLFLIFTQCRKDENIKPEFSWEVLEEAPDGVTIKFTDESSMVGPQANFSYTWDFGDNSIGGNTTAKSPEHKYEVGGFIEVSLTIRGQYDEETIRKKVTIPGMVADFDTEIRDLNTVIITNKSMNYGGDETKFYWDMGDGEILTTQDATFEHEYTSAGDYKINLRIERGNERALAAKSITISDFSVDFLIHEISLNEIEIEDKTENIFGEMATLHIDFGDGTVYDSPYNLLPSRIPKSYDRSGNYQITYTISRGTEKGVAIKTINISDFLVDFNLSQVGVINRFEISDNSGDLFGDYQISIDFGDGSDIVTFDDNSYETYVKEYAKAGSFLINYTITRGAEVGYATKSANIEYMNAGFNFVQQGSTTNQFTMSDASENLFGNEEVIVDFGDGTTPVSLPNVPYDDYTKTYSNGGTYNITYTVKRGSETSTAVKTVTVNSLIADFNITQGASNNIFIITDNSQNLIGGETATIDFGDGSPVVEVDNLSTPQEKTYESGGIYNITYTVIRGDEISSRIKSVSVPEAFVNFSFSVGSDLSTVTFTDLTTNYSSSDIVTWDFGDGQTLEYNVADGWQEIVTHQYNQAGNFTVTLNYLQGTVNKTITKTVNITGLNSNIGINLANGSTEFEKLLNMTYGSNIVDANVTWDFGDGTTETYNVPADHAHNYVVTHTYTEGGNFWVTLTVEQGADIVTANRLVTVIPPTPMDPKFSYPTPLLIQGETIYFTNTSEEIPPTATKEWFVTPSSPTDATITEIGDDLEVEFLLDQTYTVTVRYTDGANSETASVATLAFAALSADFTDNTYTWDSGNSNADIEFGFTTTNPTDADGATFDWKLFDSGGTELQTGTDLNFSVTDLPAGTGYYIEATRNFGSVQSPTVTKAFSITPGGVFSWD